MLGFVSQTGAPPDEHVQKFLAGASLAESYKPAKTCGPCSIAISQESNGAVREEDHLLIVYDGNLRLKAEAGSGSKPSREVCRALAAAWRQEGEKALQRVLGEYGLCVYDAGHQLMYLARDPLGFRPLYFCRTATGLAFASRADAFTPLGSHFGYPDYDTFLDNLCFHEPGERSFFSGVQQVLPGELVIVSRRSTVRRKWWCPELTPNDFKSQDELLNEYRSMLNGAVADATEDAGPVLASHLSAGLDSGMATAVAARLRPGNTHLIAFTGVPGAHASVGTSGRLLDEGKLAREAANFMPGVEHRLVTAIGDPMAPLYTAAALYQQPLPNPFNAGWFSRIQDEASSAGARTLLIGQLGNYSFSMSADRPPLIRSMARRLRGIVAPTPRQFTSGLFLRERPSSAHKRNFSRDLVGAERRLRLMSSLNPGALLRGTQKHWGLRLRDPYSDRALIEFSLRIPEKMLRALGKRGLARAVAKDNLPPALLIEQRRGYQSADWIARLQAHHDSAARLVARSWDHHELRRILDLPALDLALQRLRHLRSLSAADEWLYRTELPRTLAVAAFVQSVES